MSFIFCGISLPTIRRFGSRAKARPGLRGTPSRHRWRGTAVALGLHLSAMTEPTKRNPTQSPDIEVSMPDVVKFVRQLGHDLRNHLNAAELQSAYIAELTEDAELKEEIKRLRAMVSEVGVSLQHVTSALGTPRLTLMPYDAADFVEDLRQKLAIDFPDESAKIEWNVRASKATLQIDPQALQSALLELFANAFRHERAEGLISVEAR